MAVIPDIGKINQLLFNNKITQLQIDGINAVASEFNNRNLEDKRWLAYILATIYHETARKMQPITELGGINYLKSKSYYPYYGRDLLQTTWLGNYKKVKSFSGVDVVTYPEKIKEMPLAASVAVEFMNQGYYTGKKLSNYFNQSKDDPLNARRIINGTDKAEDIKNYYQKFLLAMQ